MNLCLCYNLTSVILIVISLTFCMKIKCSGHIGITLSMMCLSVCLTVTLCFCSCHILQNTGVKVNIITERYCIPSRFRLKLTFTFNLCDPKSRDSSCHHEQLQNLSLSFENNHSKTNQYRIFKRKRHKFRYTPNGLTRR